MGKTNPREKRERKAETASTQAAGDSVEPPALQPSRMLRSPPKRSTAPIWLRKVVQSDGEREGGR